MDSGQAADLAIFILCCLLLLSYALFYFTVDSFRLPLLGRRFVNLYSINVHSRAEWVRLLVRDPKEGINAVQTVRNQVLAVSILAAASAPLASTLIQVMTDSSKLDQLAQYSAVDPITDAQLISPPVKLGIALGVLFLAIMAYAQSVRLSVHVGYMIRVAASEAARHEAITAQVMVIMRRSSRYFAIGLRLFFAFGPLVLYVLGPTALLIATVLDVTAQVLFDIVPEESELVPAPPDEEKPGGGAGDGAAAAAAAPVQ